MKVVTPLKSVEWKGALCDHPDGEFRDYRQRNRGIKGSEMALIVGERPGAWTYATRRTIWQSKTRRLLTSTLNGR